MESSGYIEEAVTFSSGDNTLEGYLAYPAEQEPRNALLLLSPHPHMRGHMGNNVIQHIARRAAEEGSLTLRFNYHGVGGSTSHITGDADRFTYWSAMEERQSYEELLPDAQAALQYLGNCMNNQLPIVLLGYSLGAILVGMLGHQDEYQHVIAIAPPNAKAGLRDFDRCRNPKLFIAGDRDFAFDKEDFLDLYDYYTEPKAFVEMTDCDHFFRKQEETLFQHIRSALESGE